LALVSINAHWKEQDAHRDTWWQTENRGILISPICQDQPLTNQLMLTLPSGKSNFAIVRILKGNDLTGKFGEGNLCHQIPMALLWFATTLWRCMSVASKLYFST